MSFSISISAKLRGKKKTNWLQPLSLAISGAVRGASGASPAVRCLCSYTNVIAIDIGIGYTNVMAVIQNAGKAKK